MSRKYELTETNRDINGVKCFQIRALRGFKNVKKGELGGWVESEKNLSHEGNCWISDDAVVYNNARIYGNAQVYVKAQVFGEALIYGYARIFDYAEVYGNAQVSDYARVNEYSQVYGNARISSNTLVYGDAQIDENTEVFHQIRISGTAQINQSEAKVQNDFDFPSISSNVSEITINNIKYIKKTTWEQQS